MDDRRFGWDPAALMSRASRGDLVKEYEEERLHVRFKHPDRNDTVERQYARYRLKSLQEMEKETGLDGRLSRIKARVMATFPLPPQDGFDCWPRRCLAVFR